MTSKVFPELFAGAKTCRTKVDPLSVCADRIGTLDSNTMRQVA